MKTENASGAVIIKKVNSAWNVLCIRDMNKNLTFPKGLMKEGENEKQTAIREAQEETGISSLVYKAPLPDVDYWYMRNGETLQKKVTYHLFIYEGNENLKPQLEEGISDILWLPIDQAIASIGYPKSNLPVLNEVKRIMTV